MGPVITTKTITILLLVRKVVIDSVSDKPDVSFKLATDSVSSSVEVSR